MLIHDELYGCFEIAPVLDELVQCKAIQRLKKIHQGGATFLVDSRWSGTRYDHSIGVMLLIKLLGGGIEEQILGLLHDVSHTAFSHVIDYVLEDELEDFHETLYEEMVMTSEIPTILSQYGYNYKTILNMNSSRLEASLPSLCADRIDYTLRDLYHCGYVSLQEIQSFIQDLSFVDNQIVIQSLDMAEWFTKAYYHEVIDFFMHPLNIYANHQLTQVLKEALDEKIITLEDFKQDDEFLLNHIRNSENDSLIQALNQIHSEVILVEDKAHYDIHKKLKPRMVNPIVCFEGDFKKLSDISTSANTLIQMGMGKLQKGVSLRIKSK